jgi:hypothetical protein
MKSPRRVFASDVITRLYGRGLGATPGVTRGVESRCALAAELAAFVPAFAPALTGEGVGAGGAALCAHPTASTAVPRVMISLLVIPVGVRCVDTESGRKHTHFAVCSFAGTLANLHWQLTPSGLPFTETGSGVCRLPHVL